MPVSIKEYNCWLGEISKRYRQSQIKAAVAVNTEMLKFYWSLGADIVRMEKDQPWGSGFLKRLSVDLKLQMPEAECFSITNLNYIRYFYSLYSHIVILPQLGEELTKHEKLPQTGAELNQALIVPQAGDLICHQVGEEMVSPIFHVPWGHHKCLIDKFRKEPDKAMFYVREIVKNGWSRAVLMHFMDTSLYERQGKAVTNFAVALPAVDSDLAQEMTKDPYCFDFIALTPKYREKELKDAMMAHIEKFLLELGQGFMLVGRECHLQVGAKEVIADLLFFNMNLNRYVVVEVKAGEFAADHLGQLGLYVSAVNHILKKPTHEPTIGLLVCKTKDNTMVKWALESSQQPIGVSEYRISEILPKEIASDLPSIADIESAVGGVR